jgi:hypothetical protein
LEEKKEKRGDGERGRGKSEKKIENKLMQNIKL